jgi:hypothetical protein
VAMHERTEGKMLWRLKFRHMSVRPQHPQSDEAAQEAFRKTSPRCSTVRSRRRKSWSVHSRSGSRCYEGGAHRTGRAVWQVSVMGSALACHDVARRTPRLRRRIWWRRAAHPGPRPGKSARHDGRNPPAAMGECAITATRAMTRRSVLAGTTGLLASPAIIGRAVAATRGVSDSEIVIGMMTDLSGVTAVQGSNAAKSIRMSVR